MAMVAMPSEGGKKKKNNNTGSGGSTSGTVNKTVAPVVATPVTNPVYTAAAAPAASPAAATTAAAASTSNTKPASTKQASGFDASKYLTNASAQANASNAALQTALQNALAGANATPTIMGSNDPQIQALLNTNPELMASTNPQLQALLNAHPELAGANPIYSAPSMGSSVDLYNAYAQMLDSMPEYNYSSFSYTPYKGAYDELISNAMDRLTNFQYDPESDQSYLAYKKQYTNLGQQAQEDALARLAARTGGIANSYAVSAAQQQYNNYMQALTDKIPELEQIAYDRLQNELTNYRNLDSDAYNRYLQDRGMDFNIWQSDDANNFRKYQTDVDAYDKRLGYALGRAQAAENRELSDQDYLRNLAATDLAYQRDWETSNRDFARQLGLSDLDYQRDWETANRDFQRQIAASDLDYGRDWETSNRDYGRQLTTDDLNYLRQTALNDSEYVKELEKLGYTHEQAIELAQMDYQHDIDMANLDYQQQVALWNLQQAARAASGGGGGGSYRGGSGSSGKSGSEQQEVSYDNSQNWEYLLASVGYSIPTLLQRLSEAGYENGNLYDMAEELYYSSDNGREYNMSYSDLMAMQQKYRVG